MKEKKSNFYTNNKKLILISGAFLVVAIVASIIVLVLMGGSNNQDKVWQDVLLKDNLPAPQKGTIRLGSNLDDWLGFEIKKVNKSYYNEYKKECIEMGYTVESKESGNSYNAFNEDGYEVTLTFIKNYINVILDAPEEMSEIVWPKEGIGSKLPAPVSSYGKVTTDSSTTFRVLMGKTSKDEFNKYVQSCQENGFKVDYNKQEEYYSAKDKDGYRLNIQYVGNETIDILIEEPKKEDNSTTTEPESNDDIRKDFKDAMDSYEKFIDEYVEFMKKYTNNPTDTGLLADYTKYLEKYNKFVSDFEKWEDKDLNKKEAEYYLQVETRVSKKLLDIAN